MVIAIQKINLHKILIFFIYSLFFYIFSKSNINKDNNHFKILEEKFDSRIIAFNKSINFIKKCISPDIFEFKYTSSFLLKDTKVSVVIPLYNSEKYILRSIKSIQYQNISDIEIILVDDYSKDNTTNIIEKIQSKDRRIKIIKNKKNMGILYSRSIGVLSSIGRYLFTLDNDDLFLDKDIFHISTIIGEKKNFDIIEFKAISNKIKNNDLLNNTIIDSKMSHSLQFILFQPKLGRFPISTYNFTRKYIVNDIYLWGKCIKTKIYKTALNKLGSNRYSRFMIRYEDILMNYIIFNIAKSFIFIPKYGLYHVNRLGSGSSLGKKKVSDDIT